LNFARCCSFNGFAGNLLSFLSLFSNPFAFIVFGFALVSQALVSLFLSDFSLFLSVLSLRVFFGTLDEVSLLDFLSFSLGVLLLGFGRDDAF